MGRGGRASHPRSPHGRGRDRGRARWAQSAVERQRGQSSIQVRVGVGSSLSCLVRRGLPGGLGVGAEWGHRGGAEGPGGQPGKAEPPGLRRGETVPRPIPRGRSARVGASLGEADVPSPPNPGSHGVSLVSSGGVGVAVGPTSPGAPGGIPVGSGSGGLRVTPPAACLLPSPELFRPGGAGHPKEQGCCELAFLAETGASVYADSPLWACPCP